MWRSWRARFDRPAPESPRRPPAAGTTSAALLRRLHWPALRPLVTYLGGDERSTLRGPGMELSEVREYQPGDDVRHIDWNTTARTDSPFVRESYVERALDAWFLLDLSASTAWGTARCLKRDRAVEFVAVAGQLLGRCGNRLGALTFADRPLGVMPPAAGRAHLLRLVAHARARPPDPRPGEEAGPAREGGTDLAAALARAGAVLRRRSLVLVVSDFLAPDGWQAALGRLAQRHEVVAVRLRDPREAALPDVGIVTLEDPETGRQLLVDTSDRKLRERFARAAQAQADHLSADLARRGVAQLVLSTDEDLLPPLVRFLNARRYHQRSVVSRQRSAGQIAASG